MNYRKVSAGAGWQWIVEGWRLFASRPGALLLALIVMILVQLALSLVPFIGSLISMVVTPALVGGLYLLVDRIAQVRRDVAVDPLAREQGVPLSLLFDGLTEPARRGPLLSLGGLSLLVNFFLAVLLVTTMSLPEDPAILQEIDQEQLKAMIAGVSPWAWLLLFAGWALWMAAMTFAVPLAALGGQPALAALRQSLAAIAANLGAFLVFGLVSAGLGMLAMMPMGLGLILFVPVMVAAVYAAYQSVFGEVSGSAGSPGSGNEEPLPSAQPDEGVHRPRRPGQMEF
ncbi:MAG: BPSS1780 family membrane protein [Halothiobacillaceae bacterium]